MATPFEFNRRVTVEGLALPPVSFVGIEVHENGFAFVGEESREIASVPRTINKMDLHGSETFKGSSQLTISWGPANRLPLGGETISLCADSGGTHGLSGARMFLDMHRLHPKKSDAILLEYSENHLKYEIQMFFRTAEELYQQRGPGGLSDEERLRVNSTLESCVIHLRNLIQFFYPGKRYETDVIAAKYCDWGAVRPTQSQTLRNAKERADRELAHLTTFRMNETWDELPHLGREIRDLLLLFARHTSYSLSGNS